MVCNVILSDYTQDKTRCEESGQNVCHSTAQQFQPRGQPSCHRRSCPSSARSQPIPKRPPPPTGPRTDRPRSVNREPIGQVSLGRASRRSERSWNSGAAPAEFGRPHGPGCRVLRRTPSVAPLRELDKTCCGRTDHQTQPSSNGFWLRLKAWTGHSTAALKNVPQITNVQEVP